MEKVLSISLKLDFTPNTLGCYGLHQTKYHMLESSLLNVCFKHTHAQSNTYA